MHPLFKPENYVDRIDSACVSAATLQFGRGQMLSAAQIGRTRATLS
jgi:hypothetical protein